MHYRYVSEKENYEDFAAGRVLLSQTGMTSFPVRLASEIFQRCADTFPSARPLRVYDPCCGGGYLLTVLGFLHGARIHSLYGSDINPDLISLASDNLRLLTAEGLDARCDTLHRLADTYHKASHYDALDSAARLRQRLPASPLPTYSWVADAFRPATRPASVDLIICDVPYGSVTTWQADLTDNLIAAFLQAQEEVLVADGIIAVISDKSQKAIYPGYKRLQQETVGKRRFLLLQKASIR
jgi:23S rRNA (guanine2535-N1)-methyltransferase